MKTRQFVFLAATVIAMSSGVILASTQEAQQSQTPIIELSRLSPESPKNVQPRTNSSVKEEENRLTNQEEPVHNIKL